MTNHKPEPKKSTPIPPYPAPYKVGPSSFAFSFTDRDTAKQVIAPINIKICEDQTKKTIKD